MKLRIMSDLHLEFGGIDLPKSDDEGSTHLILAGDIFLGERCWMPVPFFEDISERFAQIILIAGNHEYYDGEFPGTLGTIRNVVRDFPNITVLEKETLIINDVAFIGATLWTDMNKKDWFCIQKAKSDMNDFYKIKLSNGRKLHPNDVVDDHSIAREYIFTEIDRHKTEGRKVVVITHHLPCPLSVPTKFRNDPLNGAYVSDLTEGIFALQPDLWVHGHTHTSCDYLLDNTRVVCNPRGYFNYETNREFDATLTIDLNDSDNWNKNGQFD